MIRGSVQDRPWGKTLGTLSRRGVTGQLTVRNHNAQFGIAFQHGLVVAASAPGSGETAVTLAFRQGLITPAQLAELEHRRPGDDVQLLAEVAELSADQVLRLRRQSLAACVARTFVFESGEFTFASEITLPIAPNTATHIGGLIFHGARTYLGERRLEDAVRELGSRFKLRADQLDAVSYFGFADRERDVVNTLVEGTSVSGLDRIVDETDRRIARAAVYALGSCGVLDCEPTGRLARGTADRLSRATTKPEIRTHEIAKP